jgi:predicted type IV restriction endonuclease
MKKLKPPLIKTGIWIDQEKAILIRLEGIKEPVIEKMISGVESRIRIKGEVKASARFGKAFIDDQEKKQRRQRNQRKRFFDEIITRVQHDDCVFLFGPGKAKEELKNAFEKVHMDARLLAMETADRMTQNQVVEKTVNYFSGNNFRDDLRSLKKS